MIKRWAAQPPAQLAEQPAANPADARTDSQRVERGGSKTTAEAPEAKITGGLDQKATDQGEYQGLYWANARFLAVDWEKIHYSSGEMSRIRFNYWYDVTISL